MGLFGSLTGGFGQQKSKGDTSYKYFGAYKRLLSPTSKYLSQRAFTSPLSNKYFQTYLARASEAQQAALQRQLAQAQNLGQRMGLGSTLGLQRQIALQNTAAQRNALLNMLLSADAQTQNRIAQLLQLMGIIGRPMGQRTTGKTTSWNIGAKLGFGSTGSTGVAGGIPGFGG